MIGGGRINGAPLALVGFWGRRPFRGGPAAVIGAQPAFAPVRMGLAASFRPQAGSVIGSVPLALALAGLVRWRPPFGRGWAATINGAPPALAPVRLCCPLGGRKGHP